MNIEPWVIQGLLAAVFLSTTLAKIVQPKDRVAVRIATLNDPPPAGYSYPRK